MARILKALACVSMSSFTESVSGSPDWSAGWVWRCGSSGLSGFHISMDGNNINFLSRVNGRMIVIAKSLPLGSSLLYQELETGGSYVIPPKPVYMRLLIIVTLHIAPIV